MCSLFTPLIQFSVTALSSSRSNNVTVTNISFRDFSCSNRLLQIKVLDGQVLRPDLFWGQPDPVFRSHYSKSQVKIPNISIFFIALTPNTFHPPLVPPRGVASSNTNCSAIHVILVWLEGKYAPWRQTCLSPTGKKLKYQAPIPCTVDVPNPLY